MFICMYIAPKLFIMSKNINGFNFYKSKINDGIATYVCDESNYIIWQCNTADKYGCSRWAVEFEGANTFEFAGSFNECVNYLRSKI